jgi:hypothetical protein
MRTSNALDGTATCAASWKNPAAEIGAKWGLGSRGLRLRRGFLAGLENAGIIKVCSMNNREMLDLHRWRTQSTAWREHPYRVCRFGLLVFLIERGDGIRVGYFGDASLQGALVEAGHGGGSWSSSSSPFKSLADVVVDLITSMLASSRSFLSLTTTLTSVCLALSVTPKSNHLRWMSHGIHKAMATRITRPRSNPKAI